MFFAGMFVGLVIGVVIGAWGFYLSVKDEK